MSSSSRLRAAAYVFLTFVVVALKAVAQAQPASPPAYIAHVEGVVTLEHEGQAEPAAVNVPLVGGDRLFTGNGRAQIVFPDGTSLDVVENSEVDFDSPTRYRVTVGSIERQPAPQTSAPSPYLPENLETYAPTLEESGTWEYEEQYGYVWYPSVSVDWRPLLRRGTGRIFGRTAGRGSGRGHGPGRHTITAAGATGGTAGSGCPAGHGVRRMCRGPSRPST